MSETAATGTAASTKVVTGPFLALVTAGMLFFLGMGVVIPILPRYVEEDLGGSSLIVGIVVGAFAFSAVLMRPTAGRLGNRRGRRFLMITGGVITAVSLLGYGLAHSEWQLILMRLITGAGDGLFFTGSATLVADIAPPERRGQALSWFSITAYLGQGIGPTIGESIASSAGKPWAFSTAGLLCLAGAVASLRAPDPRLTFAGAAQARQPLLNRKALGPGAVLALGLMGYMSFSVYVPLYVKDLHMDGSKFVFLLYSAVVMLLRLVGGRLPDRFGVARIGTVATTSIALGLVVAAAWATPAGVYAAVVFLGIGMAIQYPALMAMAVNRATDSERSAVVGSFTAFFDLAGGTGGLLLGVVVGAAGYRAGFLAGACFALAALALLRLRVARPVRLPGPAAG